MTANPVTYPRPPIWISKSIINCPKFDQCSDVSTTIKPVTSVAEVDVNRASKKFVVKPLEDETGSISKSVPTSMLVRNARARPDKGVFHLGTKLPRGLTCRLLRLTPTWWRTTFSNGLLL